MIANEYSSVELVKGQQAPNLQSRHASAVHPYYILPGTPSTMTSIQRNRLSC